MNSAQRPATGIVSIFTVIAVIAAGAYFLFGGKDASGTVTETVRIDRGDIQRSVATSGAVRALVTVEVGTQLSGQIAELFADFNSQVTQGQLIARIDPKTFESRVQQAGADLKVAQANVEVQQAAIARAEANLRRARLDFERQEPLLKKGTISQTSFDTVRADYEAAQAELQMARAELANARAAVEQRRAVLTSAEIDLERTYIRSPVDGVVIERVVNVGQTVAASMSSPVLFKIANDLRDIQIQASVDEADIGNVKQGNEVTFSVDAYPDDKFSGNVEVVRLAPVELQNVVTYTVVITAKNPDLKLLPGMTANVEIVTGKRHNVLRVANEALRFRPPDQEQAEEGAHFTAGPSPEQREAVLRRGLEPLGVSGERIQKIAAEMQEQMTAVMENSRRQTLMGSIDPAIVREQMEVIRERILRENLTPEQFDQFQRQTRAGFESRMGQVWIDGGARLEPKMLRLGISDMRYTEITGGEVEEGMEVITRIRGKSS